MGTILVISSSLINQYMVIENNQKFEIGKPHGLSVVIARAVYAVCMYLNKLYGIEAEKKVLH